MSEAGAEIVDAEEAHDRALELLYQAGRCCSGATGREHIIRDQHALAFDDRVGVRFE